MLENEISKVIVDVCFCVHSGMGPGLFESVYEEIMDLELRKYGFKVSRQEVVPVVWLGQVLEQGFRADLIVENKVIVEIKSVEYLLPVHHKQLLTYLRLTDLKLGLLVNFNEKFIRDGIKRIVNGL
jgi:GxxExxY protein